MGAFGIKIPEGIRRTRPLADELHPRDGARDVQGRIDRRAAFRESVDRSSAAAQALRHRRAEEEILPASRKGRDLGVRAHGSRRWIGSGEHAHNGDADRGWPAFHPQRRETLVHEWNARRAVRCDGENSRRPEARQDIEADHRVHRRCEHARSRSRTSPSLHGTQGNRKRRHPIHQRESPAREHSLG